MKGGSGEKGIATEGKRPVAGVLVFQLAFQRYGASRRLRLFEMVQGHECNDRRIDVFIREQFVVRQLHDATFAFTTTSLRNAAAANSVASRMSSADS